MTVRKYERFFFSFKLILQTWKSKKRKKECVIDKFDIISN